MITPQKKIQSADAAERELSTVQKETKCDEEMENPQEFEQSSESEDVEMKSEEIKNDKIIEDAQVSVVKQYQKLSTHCEIINPSENVPMIDLKQIFIKQLLWHTKQRQLEIDSKN